MNTSKANSLVDALNKEILNLVSTEGMDELNPIELARSFVALRILKEKLEVALKPFDAFYEEMAKVKIPTMFERHKVPNVTLEEGYRVQVSHTLRASIRGGQDKEAAYQWLRDNGLGDLVTETVNAATLSAAAKAMAEENRELDGDLFNVAIMANTSFVRVKGK